MSIPDYISKQKEIQRCLLEFINHKSSEKAYYLNLLKLLDNPEIRNSPSELSTTLRLLLEIANNHHRLPDFFNKITQVLLLFKDDIKKHFSNIELFHLFKKNKEILLILIEQKMLTIDQAIVDVFTSPKFRQHRYPCYFSPEIQNFEIDSHIQREIKTKIDECNKSGPDAFEKRRKAGENYIQFCHFIRKDSLEEFTAYVNEHKLSLSTAIEPSIFETNYFLVNRIPTLIEYCAFFGSLRILNYLIENNVKIPPSIWIYAIHSQSMDLLHLIEEKKILPQDQTYVECFTEAVKCHHIEMAEYFKTVYLHNQIPDNARVASQIIRFRNYTYFPEDLSTPNNFYDLCKYNYIKLVDLILTEVGDIDTNIRIISNLFVLNKISNLFVLNRIPIINYFNTIPNDFFFHHISI